MYKDDSPFLSSLRPKNNVDESLQNVAMRSSNHVLEKLPIIDRSWSTNVQTSYCFFFFFMLNFCLLYVYVCM